ncbi:acetyltransferase [Peribacillus psychrosaccharolyticus]|uniref:Acetyltransferase n=1 Tax=Peribacillus psychrosaccharolyticus TaxID=1407 RepID=A0A974NN61_PERPY|nr:acetyltransferase [Peribacillus psychrosaccharolyticus]MEC2056060.1 acetyltransferase [Peribacillus psychrosaccharolyticus]MED3745501.1 acetyltransferase [Peribacillus psychrosaccharolyticus]QQT00742.1 acetyltransferase [Peribacillus psychrosaccharolyticus]
MKIVIVGDGGHSKVITDLITSQKDDQIVGYLDDKYQEIFVKNHQFFGPLSTVHNLRELFNDIKYIVAIGNNVVRKQIVQRLDLPNDYYATLQHKSALVSPSAKIGFGSVIMANTVVNADSQIGNHSIINTGSIVEHDNKLADFVHICPNATLTGSVIIGDGVQIGAGATLIPNVRIREWAIIGAGATVITNIPAYSTAVGTPANVKNIERLRVSEHGNNGS